MRLKIDIHLKTSEFKVNRVIKYFVISDLFFWGGWGLINPIFALFIVGRISGGSAMTVGIATALYWIVKALAQIPIALYLDRRDRDHFDLHFLIIGLMFAGFVAMLFPLIYSANMLYALMVLQGLAYGIYTPSWSAVFSRHLDKSHYAFDWSLDSTTVGLSSGIAALIGGVIAGIFGFDAVFVLTGFFSFASGLLLLAVPDLVMPRDTVQLPPILPDHSPDGMKE